MSIAAKPRKITAADLEGLTNTSFEAKQKAIVELNAKFKQEKALRRREVESQIGRLWFDYRERKRVFKEDVFPSDVNEKIGALWAEYKETNRKELEKLIKQTNDIVANGVPFDTGESQA